ncbi:MAG: AMP-binding protein [Burkholderiales bacterium]|nr:AMP-binding protein [Burkholderiales bacterium]
MPLHHPPTFFSLVLRALRRHPERIAFRQGSLAVSYQQAIDFMGQVQAVLGAHGICRGMRVALLTENRYETWCASVATQGLGVATSWLHPLSSLESQVFQIRDVGATALIVDGDAFDERVRELAAALPDVLVFCVGRTSAGADLLQLAADCGRIEPLERGTAADIGTLNFTGGTTGRQKAIVREAGQVALMAIAMNSELELPEGMQYLAIGLISHVTGQLIAPTFMRGGTVHLMKKFDPVQVLETVQRERISVTLMVPTMIYRLLDAPLQAYDLASLQLVVYAGSVISPDRLKQAIQRIGPVFSQVYAQTECTPIAILRRADHVLDDPASLQACGYPMATAEIAILDDDDRPVAPGGIGEICVRSPSVMQGYLDQPAATAQALAGAWLHTGDIGFADAKGRLSIVDRKKDMIVSGGSNVYPREVEDVLVAHAAVASAAVIGVPHETWGEAVAAVVVLRPDARAEADELIAYVRDRKGPLLAPKQILFAPTLPMTPFGKVDKKKLRAPHWEQSARAI